MDRNTRHSVDKSKEFINSGMTLITDPESDKYLEKYKHINDDSHDGWWLRPEHQDSEDEDQRQESN